MTQIELKLSVVVYITAIKASINKDKIMMIKKLMKALSDIAYGLKEFQLWQWFLI